MLIVYLNSPGGVSVYIQNLITYLNEENVKFETLEYSFSKGFKTVVKKELNHFCASFSCYSSKFEIYNCLKEIFCRQELIICNDAFELEVINYLKINSEIIYILHGSIQHYDNILNEKNAIIDRVFCVSNSLMLHYKNLYKNIIFNCSPPLTKNYVEPLNENNCDTLQILFAGRLEVNKGSDLLNKTSKILLENKNVVVTYFLPKNGNEVNQINEIPNNVQVIYGLQNADVLEEFKKFDILLFPSRSEGFGLVIIECMKRGIVPFVLKNAIGPRDLVNHGITGFSFSEDEFADKTIFFIDLLLNDKKRLKEMKKAAYDFSNTVYSFNGLGKNFLNLINQKNIQLKSKSFYEMEFSLYEKIIPFFLFKIVKIIYSKFRNF